jgi:predicted glycosyltransferase
MRSEPHLMGSPCSVDAGRPGLLFYCQHSVGVGHLARSLVLAAELAERFHVTLLNGGRLPEGVAVPEGVTIVNLPPLGHAEDHALVSLDASFSVAEAMDARRAIVLRHLDTRPAVVLVELFPFGRKKFAFELMPLLESVEAMGTAAPLTVCSLRDILVGRRADQVEHDERAGRIANRFFDAVLVHADPRFVRLEESFHPLTPLSVPVHYTGFVAKPRDAETVAEPDGRPRRVIVSAGGGMVGGPLMRAAVDAFPTLHGRTGLEMLIVAGPFAPDAAWDELTRAAASIDGLQVVHHVPDLRGEIRRSAVSVSQCGYNTTMDILQAGTPALVVPYVADGEDEQTRRAERLRRAGVIRVLAADRCTPASLAEAVAGLLDSEPSATSLDLLGGTRTASMIGALSDARAARLEVV